MATLSGVFAILMWGCLAFLATSTVNIPPFQLLFICFAISFLLLLAKRIVTKQPPFILAKLTKSQWLISIIGLFGFHLCYLMALRYAPAIEVSLISYLWPMLLALCLTNKKYLTTAFIGAIFGFGGVIIIVISGDGVSFTSEFLLGYGLAFSCALLWSGYSYFQAKNQTQVDDIGWLSFAVALISLMAHLSLEQAQWSLSYQQWLTIMLLGLGPMGGAFYLWDIAMKKGNQAIVVACSYSTPLISAVILSIAGLNPWRIEMLISLSLIIFGGLIANSQQSLLPAYRRLRNYLPPRES